MKRIFAMLLALGLLLCGCTATQQSASPAAESALQSESAPAQATPMTAAVKYTEGVPQALFESPAYKSALENAGVIAYNNTVLTAADAVRAFVETANVGGSGELYYYNFTYLEDWQAFYGEETSIEEAAPWRVYGICLSAENGVVANRSFYNYDWEAPLTWLESSYATDDLRLTDWGMLVMDSESSSEPLSYTVVSGYELYDDYAERMEMQRRYIDPIGYDCLSEFDVQEGLSGWMWYFNDIYAYEDPENNNGNLWAAYPDAMIPRTLIAETLSRYFDLPYDTLSGLVAANSEYNAAKDAIRYEGGRGGLGPSPRVREWTQEENILLLTFDSCDYYTGEPLRGYLMRIRLLEDGSFRYRSVTAIETE